MKQLWTPKQRGGRERGGARTRTHFRGPATAWTLALSAGLLVFAATLPVAAKKTPTGEASAWTPEPPEKKAPTVEVDPKVVELQEIIAEFQALMGIDEHIQVSIVDNEPLLFSVRPTPAKDGYHLHADSVFLEILDPDELRAAVAHELGHVWIFTHYPYLQTEVLANNVAQRLVDRERLESLYQKMWEHQQKAGDLTAVLGPPSADETGDPTAEALLPAH